MPALEDNHPHSDAVHHPPEFLFGEGVRGVEGDLEEDEGDWEYVGINAVGRGWKRGELHIGAVEVVEDISRTVDIGIHRRRKRV